MTFSLSFSGKEHGRIGCIVEERFGWAFGLGASVIPIPMWWQNAYGFGGALS